MFVICSQPPALSEAGLQVLCPSLNSPVVNIPSLPVAPARSAIVLYAEEYGGLALWVGLRSQDGGQTALFHYQGGFEDSSDPQESLDRALSFAEGMGFIFDEDLIDGKRAGGRARALRHWLELVGEPSERPGVEPAPAPAAGDAPEAEIRSGELLLEDLIEVASADEARPPVVAAPEVDPELEILLDDGLAAEPTPAPAPASLPRPSAAERAVSLTKFRLPPAPSGPREPTPPRAAPPAELSGGSELGRIPLVRRRKAGETLPRPSLLTRLLGSF